MNQFPHIKESDSHKEVQRIPKAAVQAALDKAQVMLGSLIQESFG